MLSGSLDLLPVEQGEAVDGREVVHLKLPTRAENRRHATEDRQNAALRKLRWDDKGAKKRTSFEIRAYVGLNGAGKSLAMVHDFVPGLRAGRRVLATVRIVDPHTGNDHPLFELLTDWKQMFGVHGVQFGFDEVQGIANARASQGMPIQVQTMLHELRHQDNTLSWTAPSWSRCDLLLREVTKSVTVCRGYWPDKGSANAWRSNQLFRWITYDAADFTAWTDSSEEKLVGKQNAWLYRPAFTLFGKQLGRQSLASALYDTHGSVARIGEVLDSGRCASCGGTRRAQACSCDDYAGKRAARGHQH